MELHQNSFFWRKVIPINYYMFLKFTFTYLHAAIRRKESFKYLNNNENTSNSSGCFYLINYD